MLSFYSIICSKRSKRWIILKKNKIVKKKTFYLNELNKYIFDEKINEKTNVQLVSFSFIALSDMESYAAAAG